MANKIRFSSHIQLQYLKSHYNISEEELHNSMLHYYSSPEWNINITKSGKVNAVKRLAARTPKSKMNPQKRESSKHQTTSQPSTSQASTSQPIIIRKKRRIPQPA